MLTQCLCIRNSGELYHMKSVIPLAITNPSLPLYSTSRKHTVLGLYRYRRILLLGDRLIVVRTSEGVKMPKVKQSRQSFLRQLVTEFGDSVFTTDGSVLFCKLCEVKVSVEKRFTVQQHIRREKHLKAIANAFSKYRPDCRKVGVAIT